MNTATAATAANTDHTLRLERRFRAAPDRVFRALTDPAILKTWWGPPGFTTPRAELDVRPGGAYAIDMQAPSGNNLRIRGTFREVVAPSRLVYTWAWQDGGYAGVATLVALDFVADGTVTLLRGDPRVDDVGRHGRRSRQGLERLPRPTRGPGRGRLGMSDVIVFGSDLSPFVRTARLAFVEKGVPHQLEAAALADPAYRARHPYARMPAMEHGRVRLFETAAIARYANEGFDGPPLQPTDAVGRARMTQWISAYNAYMAVVFGQRLVIERFAPRIFDRPTNEAVIRDNLPDLDRALKVLNGSLADLPYLAGPNASLADLHVAPMLRYVGMPPEGQQRRPARPALGRWLETVLARPSFAATMPKFGS